MLCCCIDVEMCCPVMFIPVPAKPRNRAKRETVDEQSSSITSPDRSISVLGSDQIQGIPNGRTGGGICETFEQVLVLQVNENRSLGHEDSRSVVSFEQTDVRSNNQTVVSVLQTEAGLHLKLGPLRKADDSRAQNSPTMHLSKNYSDLGELNTPKLNFTEFLFEDEAQNVSKSKLIDVSSDSRLRNAPESQFTQVSGHLKAEIVSELPLIAIRSASGVPGAAESNLIDVSGDLNAHNVPATNQEAASDSRFQSASKSHQRESLCDEDYSSARSFEVTSRSESLASNFVDLDQEMSLESSESLASSSALKLDDMDSSSESRIFRGSLSDSCDNVEQEKLFDDPQQKAKTSPGHFMRSGTTKPEISKTASFPQFDVTFATEESADRALDVGDHSSLYAEILQTLAMNSPAQRSEAAASESPYSQGKAALVSSDSLNQKAYDAFVDARNARKLSAAIDGMRLEMDSMCAVEQKKHGNFASPADSGTKKGSTAILRNMSGRLPEDRKKSLNRKASRAQSFKAWQRITSRPIRKSSHKQRNSTSDDLISPEDFSFSDNDDFDFEMDSLSEDSDPDFDILSPSRRDQVTLIL